MLNSMSNHLSTDLGADEDYAEEFQDPPLSPCSGDCSAHWEEPNSVAIAPERHLQEIVTTDTVLSMYSSEQ